MFLKFLERIAKTADILQIGSRNMQNLELLKEVAKTKKPIILKRHFGSSLRDFFGAAEHILLEGNENLMLACFCSGMAGSWLGFLTQNKNPAKIFMGDTGSLAMGGALTGIAVLSNNLWALLIMGGVFVMESISVIIQVLIFKITKKYTGSGKRIFLMTPIHHHYEMKGINENIIVEWFWISTGILVVISLLLSQI